MRIYIYIYFPSSYGEEELDQNMLGISTHKLTDFDPTTIVGEMGLSNTKVTSPQFKYKFALFKYVRMVFFIVSIYTLNKTMNISSDISTVPKVNLVSILEPIFYVFSSKKFHSMIPGILLKMISLCLKLLHSKRNNQASGMKYSLEFYNVNTFT